MWDCNVFSLLHLGKKDRCCWSCARWVGYVCFLTRCRLSWFSWFTPSLELVQIVCFGWCAICQLCQVYVSDICGKKTDISFFFSLYYYQIVMMMDIRQYLRTRWNPVLSSFEVVHNIPTVPNHWNSGLSFCPHILIVVIFCLTNKKRRDGN